jgi:hypothetical protein
MANRGVTRWLKIGVLLLILFFIIVPLFRFALNVGYLFGP